MAEVQRYRVVYKDDFAQVFDGMPLRDPEGEWVSADDHTARVAALEAERDRQKSRADRLYDVVRGERERRLEAVHELRAALERAERALGNGEGLPEGCPDTYPERVGCALGILRAVTETRHE